jgi:Flp pilus assembly protein CpaB
LWVGGGLATLAAVGVLVVVNQVVPTQQEVLQVVHDLPAGSTLQAADLSSVRVRIPASMAEDALAGSDVQRVTGARLAVSLHSGHLLTASDLASSGTASAIPPGRTRLAIAWDPPAGAAVDINPGDTVIVYSTPRQGAASADVVVDHAVVVRIVRQPSAASGPASFGVGSADARATSVVLDLDLNQAARVAAASHTGSVDIALIPPLETAQ